jgi:hypothetical protein
MEAPTYFPLACAVTAREAARNAARRPAEVVPFPSREPDWLFQPDRKRGLIWWTLSDRYETRLEHTPAIDALLNLCIEQGWRRLFNALADAQLAMSEVPDPTNNDAA